MSRSPEPETLVDLALDTIAVIDESGRFRYFNAAPRDRLGFDPDELVGTDAFELVHPDDVDRVRSAFEEVVADGTPPDAPLEYRYRTADGDYVWFRTRVAPPAETGLDGYALSSRDITVEVESRRRLETIASTSPDVLWMVSADWSELLFVNGAVESVIGIGPEVLERRPRAFLSAVHADDREAVERAIERLSDGDPTNLDYRIGSSDGPTSWVRVLARPVTEGGEVVAVAGFARDVTDEYRRERQLTVMDNLLRHTIRNDMNVVDGTAELIADRAEEAVAAASTVTESGAAGHSDANGPSEVDVAAFAADLIEHAETIRRVADDLLTTAEKQRGVIDLLRGHEPPQPLRVAPLVERAVADAVGDASDATADVTVSCPDDARAFTHPELDYAVAELVENAIEHAEGTATVEIEVTARADRVEIAVRDDAPPIPPTEREPITDRWQMDDLRHTGGMGLWLVYWIADRSGGDLAFDADADGNEVTISVPDAERDPPLSVAERSRRSVPSTGPTSPDQDGWATPTAAGSEAVGSQPPDAADGAVTEPAPDPQPAPGPEQAPPPEQAPDPEQAPPPEPGDSDAAPGPP